jgi:hypothetical protein
MLTFFNYQNSIAMNRCTDRLAIRRSLLVFSITAWLMHARADHAYLERYHPGIPYNHIITRINEITVEPLYVIDGFPLDVSGGFFVIEHDQDF